MKGLTNKLQKIAVCSYNDDQARKKEEEEDGSSSQREGSDGRGNEKPARKFWLMVTSHRVNYAGNFSLISTC